MTEPDVLLVDAAQAAARKARLAATVAVIAVAFALLILAIDNSIKRSILKEAQQVRVLLDQVQTMVVTYGQTVQTGATGGAGVGAADRVADPPGPSADSNQNARPAAGRTGSRASGKAHRADGDE